VNAPEPPFSPIADPPADAPLPDAPDRPSLASRVATLAGLAAATGYVYALDPDKSGAYPRCPSRLLLGLDCPGCGGLRGTHALLHGHVAEALDHNLLLPFILAGIAIGVGGWLLPLIGRPEIELHLPRWLFAPVAVVVVAFTVARNLPGFEYLASTA
jgi:hypothetical protein